MHENFSNLEIVKRYRPKILEITEYDVPALHPLYTFIRFWGRIPYYLLHDLILYFNSGKILFDPFGGSGAVVFVGLMNGFSNIIYNDVNPSFVFIAKSIYEGLKLPESDIRKEMERIKKKIITNKVIRELIIYNNFYINKLIYNSFINLKKKISSKEMDNLDEYSKSFFERILEYMNNEKSINLSWLREEFVKDDKKISKIQQRAKFSATLNKLIEAGLVKKETKLESIILSKKLLLLSNPKKITSQEVIKKFLQKEQKYQNKIYTKPFSYKLKYSNEREFMKSNGANSIGDLFTDWSKIILSEIWKEITDTKMNKKIKDVIKVCFLASLYDSSKMQMPHKSGWIIKAFWIPPTFGVKNPVYVFFKKLNQFIKLHRVMNNETKNKNNVNVEFHNKDILEFDTELKPDIIITHPPYFSTVQYGELSSIWLAWLDKNIPFEKEIIQNPRQGKSKRDYLAMLKKSFEKISDLSRKESEIALIFQTKNVREWNLLEKVLLDLKFILKEIRCYKRISCWNSKQLFNIGEYDYVFIFKNEK